MASNTHLQEGDSRQHFTIFPREFDKNFLEHLDKRYYAILLLSLVVHLSGVFYFVANPPAGELSQAEIDKMQKRFADLVLEKPQVEEEVTFTEFSQPADVADADTGPEEAQQITGSGTGTASRSSEQTAQQTTAHAGIEQTDTETAAQPTRRTRERIRSEVKTQGLLGLLSSTSGKAAGEKVDDVLGKAAPGGQIDEKLANVTGTQKPGAEKAGDGSGRDVRGARETEGGGIEGLQVGGLEKTGTAKKVSRSGNLEVQETTPLIEQEEGEILQGARDQDAVSEVVHSHNAAIQYCYQRELRRNPDLRGKIVIRFSITPQGTVKNTTILSSTLNNERVEKCIVSRISRWNDFGAIDPAKGDTTIRQVYTFGY